MSFVSCRLQRLGHPVTALQLDVAPLLEVFPHLRGCEEILLVDEVLVFSVKTVA